MNIHQSTLKHLIPDGLSLSSEGATINTATITGEVHRIIDFFHQPKNDQIQCIAIRLKNDVAGALILIALLTQRISFYVVPKNSLAHQVPSFCDSILDIEGNGFSPILAIET